MLLHLAPKFSDNTQEARGIGIFRIGARGDRVNAGNICQVSEIGQFFYLTAISFRWILVSMSQANYSIVKFY